MKRTEMERHLRNLKKTEKKEKVLTKKSTQNGENPTVGDYINNLFSLFLYDEEKIFNTTNDLKILELLENLKTDHPEKQWDNVIKKAIKKAKIIQKEKAYSELMDLIN